MPLHSSELALWLVQLGSNLADFLFMAFFILESAEP